tara:strand:+ start:632 stop:784 length:153 start_codon:yes stop_codon:yes gene_type:complete
MSSITIGNSNGPKVITAEKEAEFILQGAEQDCYKEQDNLAHAEEVTRNGR